MIADMKTETGMLSISLTVESTDTPEPSPTVSLSQDAFGFELPFLTVPDGIHPDLVALATLLCVRPFVGQQLMLRDGVSSYLRDAVFSCQGIEIGPVDEHLAPRTTSTGRVGLAFSGGVDSTAALAVLPEDTASIFLLRAPVSSVSPRPSRSMYRPAAALASCRHLAHAGRSIVVVRSDLELLRSPVGFPVDLANAAPTVLLADELGLDAVAWGTIAESAYRVGHARFQEYYDRPAYTSWAPIFAAVGLPVLNPVCGVSEVGTSLICNVVPLGRIAQSCVRGAVGRPCSNCWKCFRKSLLDAALQDTWPDEASLDALFGIREAQRFLAGIPIKHENVVGFVAERYAGRHLQMRLLADRVFVPEGGYDYLRRWYTPSAAAWPSRHADGITRRLTELLGVMSTEDEQRFRGWALQEELKARGLHRAAMYPSLSTAIRACGEAKVEGTSPTTKGMVDRLEQARSDVEVEQQRTQQVEARLAETLASRSLRVGNLLAMGRTRG